MKGVFQLIMLIVFISCSGKEDIERANDTLRTSKDLSINSLPLFKIYGELAPEGYLNDQNSITEEYGFKLKRVDGCTVGSFEAKGIHKENRASLEEMNTKHGEGWMENFERKTGYKLAIPFD